MPVQYYFDNLDPVSFQRLVNSLLTGRYGEAVRLLPLRGRDGGRDAETAAGSPAFALDIKPQNEATEAQRFPPGRYIFQVKYHRTADRQGSVVRSSVLTDFSDELNANILTETHLTPINFFVITNVPGSKESFAKVDEVRRDLLRNTGVHADVLWQEHVTSWLDQLPQVWPAFREIFAGSVVPAMGEVAQVNPTGLPRSLRLAIATQFERDGVVRFRQINLEQRLSRLFVDLEARAPQPSRSENTQLFDMGAEWEGETIFADGIYHRVDRVSSINLLIGESSEHGARLIFEGGPGQGKSTITQAVAQLYRALLLQKSQEYQHICPQLNKARFPFRIELRAFAEWLGSTDRSVELYLAETFSKDAGGASITVEDIHSIVEHSPSLLIFDGLDEVGSDELRHTIIEKIVACVSRFETELHADLRCIVTSRPPAIAGCADRMQQFRRCQVLPLNPEKVVEYSRRWAEVQCGDLMERERVILSFEKRKEEQHVAALVKNPMQLSVLLHFIRLKGEAFPDRRAELYREYFKTVIDRDVEKSPALRQNRDEIEALHEVIAFEIHKRAETDLAKTQLSRTELLEIVSKWLAEQGKKPEIGKELFRLGEERLGLIVALKGEGANVRYGYEVQPVREYFAAAYINDKREGDAHELFPAMIRRVFWREVALFLAGLRRVNEKADLLLRARSLDEDPTDGWRQQGRAIVLQLLLEGVLSSPGHVYRDAIAFLIGLLDPANRTARNEPHDFAGALPKLIRMSGSEEHTGTLLSYLENSKTCDDRHSLWRLYAVASRVLPVEAIWGHITAYQGTRADLMTRVKLLWPAVNGLDVARIKSLSGFSPAVASPDWAQACYTVGIDNPNLASVISTVEYHGLLLEMFAFDGIVGFSRSRLSTRDLGPGYSLAVWKLCENLKVITNILTSREGNPQLDRPPVVSVSYEGLDASMVRDLRDLLESCAIVADGLNEGRQVGRAMKPLLDVLRRLLITDGIVGWIACRCATALMMAIEVPRYEALGGQTIHVQQRGSAFARSRDWAAVRRAITKFYRAGIPNDLDTAGRTFAARIISDGYAWSVPSHVLINEQMVSVPEAIVRAAIEGTSVPIGWIERVPIARYWRHEMLSHAASGLEKVLSLFAQRPIMWGGPSVGLTLVEMQRISAVAHRSGNPEILAGALCALLGSNFINVVGIDRTLAMLEADSHFLDVGARLFPPRRHTRQSVDNKLMELAEAIVSGAEGLSQATAVAAARFLDERRAISLPPLGSLIH